MQFRKKYLPQIGGVLLIASALTLLAPRTVHALAAALVQVTNTVSNPAITQDSTRAASQIVLLLTPSDVEALPGHELAMHEVIPTQGESSNAYVVPAGQNLVLTEVDLNVYADNPNTFVELEHDAGGFHFADLQFFLPSSGHQEFRYGSGVVVPAGASVYINNLSPFGANVNAMLHGYLTAN